MQGNLTLTAVFMLGLFASGHCLLMCGGIMGALGMATKTNNQGRPALKLLFGYQIGRIISYALAGFSLAGIAGGLLHFFDQATVRFTLRWLSALSLALTGLSLLGLRSNPSFRFGHAIWQRLAPIARRFLPVRHMYQALALGALWGWMPCGFVYSVLLIAWLSMNPWRSAAIMFVFGLGTIPAVLAGSLGMMKGLALLHHAGVRAVTAIGLLLLAALTMIGPWLIYHGIWHTSWLPMDCITP